MKKSVLFRSLNVKKCSEIFYTDMTSIVDENYNFTKHIIEYIN